MKAVSYTFVLTAIFGFWSVPVPGEMKIHPLSDKPLVMARPHPALIGIEELRAVLLRSGADPVIDGLHWTQLKADVIDELNQSQIKLIAGPVDRIVDAPELRVYVNLLRLANSQYVFRIQTSVARSVCLKEQDHPIFKADLWTLNPVFETVSADEMPARITEVVLGQIKAFVRAYRTANPQSQSLADHKANETNTNETETDRPQTTMHGYIASNSSDIFHKPDCRWAKNISPENLVTYTNREQAIKDGKRPCKWCKP
ncbi:MAG: hypothetical protein JXM79_18220 [Sedimentisphaerales bacterium]|nr:hypothetical protein [Sedimentisphaerales bacterium]